MSDEIDVKIKAKLDGLAGGLAEAKSLVKGAVGDMKSSFSSLTSVVDAVKSHWLGIVTVLGGGKLFKDAMHETVEWTSSIVDLSKRLGITTEEASGLKVALDDLGIGTDEYATIAAKMTRQMRANEQAFQSLGIRTKEGNGEWRNSQEILADVIGKLNGMKAGTDRNVAAQALLGARVGNINQVLRLNADFLKESAEKAKELHLIVGPEGAAKMREYKLAMNDIKDIGTSLQVQIGNALLPVLLRLGQFFGAEGPRLASLFGDTISFVAKAMLGAYAAGNALVQSVRFLKVLLMTPIGKGWMGTVTAAFHEMGDEIQRVNDDVADAIMRINNPTLVKHKASAAPAGEDLGGDDLNKGGKDAKKEKFALQMAQFKVEEALAQENSDKLLEIKRQELEAARTLFGEHSVEYLTIAKDLVDTESEQRKRGERAYKDLLDEQKKVEKEAFDERRQQWEELLSGISRAVETSVLGIIQGTTTMGAAIKNMLKSIALEYISMGVKTLVHHKAMELAKTGATAQGTAQRVALEYWAQVKAVAVSAWGAISRIGMYAIEGAAAAFKAIAAIPIVGPALAPAAAAAAGLAIGSFAGRIASAEGGYDIPSGVNPMTQLHQNEMVLPAHLADKIRGMTGAGSGGDTHLHVHTMDVKGVKQFLYKHKDHLVAVLKGETRNFAFDEG